MAYNRLEKMLGLQSFDNAGWRDKKTGNWCFLVLSLCLLPCVPAELGPEGVAAPVAFGITDLDDLLTCFFLLVWGPFWEWVGWVLRHYQGKQVRMSCPSP